MAQKKSGTHRDSLSNSWDYKVSSGPPPEQNTYKAFALSLQLALYKSIY